jgi:uncharacterized protein (TIGR02145 family)
MKKLLIPFVMIFAIGITGMAQAPEKFSYQAVIRDASNDLVVNAAVGLRITIQQGMPGGTDVYQETHSAMTNANGLVSLEIGGGSMMVGDFSTIDWGDGPYFLQTEIDPSGGTTYSIIGTIELISVPYALYAKTAETIAGGITETDPVFGASVAAGITGTDTANWNLDNDPTNEIQNLSVSRTGDTLYMSNDGYVIIPGISAANPQFPSGAVHCSGTPTAIVDVMNSFTGKTWMDRNLGANRAATSSTDAESYGSLYQWGRGSDGHQCINRFVGDGVTTSGVTALNATSSSDTPGHGDFIIVNTGNFDWRSPQNDNLWQGVNGVNNPCPTGYRLPTEAELNAERLSWVQSPISSTNNAAGAFDSPLKLPVAGYRLTSTGLLTSVGTVGGYWSSTVSSTNSLGLLFSSSTANMSTSVRASGLSVRCLKETL